MWCCTESGWTVPFKSGSFLNNEAEHAGFFSFDYIVMDSTAEWGQNTPLADGTGRLPFTAGRIVTTWSVTKRLAAASPPLPRSHDHFLISAIWSHSVLRRELNRNRIRQVEGLTFQGLSSLEVLKLQRNSITKLTDGAFWDLSKMKTLYVRKTQDWIICEI